MNANNPALIDFIRSAIRERGPVTFRWFMEQALYHPEHGFYSAGRCVIGRHGDYFTNVSVGPLFGRLMAKQFSEIWDQLGRPGDFTIAEQGAHDGTFAHDVLEAASLKTPEFFSALRYRIIEPFPVLQSRQGEALESFQQKVEWRKAVDELDPFIGIHFSNELIDAMPVHLITALGNQWREKYVAAGAKDFEFFDGPLSTEQLREHLNKLPAPHSSYETEVNLAALDWIEQLSTKLERGFVLAVDYGYAREEFYAPQRSSGTLRSFAQHRIASSPLADVGYTDITSHVDWTNLSKRAEECGLRVQGFTDQHHFITGLTTTLEPNELGPADRRALQTLLHPGLLGRTFQFLAFSKNIPPDIQLAGFKYARDPRVALGLSRH